MFWDLRSSNGTGKMATGGGSGRRLWTHRDRSGRLCGTHEKGSEQEKTNGFSSELCQTVPTTQVWFSKFPKSLK